MSAPDLPVAMLAELTHRCPLQCPYCSNPTELVRVNREMDTATWQRVFSEAAELGVLQVHLSGGEPTLRPDLPELVRHAASVGLYTNLITAGVLLDQAKLERLADAGLEHVQLSVQDVEPANANRIGGYKNGHAKKLEVAKWVRAVGLPLTLNAVVHRQNLDRIEQVIELALTLDAHRLEVAHVQYYGWAFVNRASLMPTRDQLDHATDVVKAARERLQGRLVIDYVVPDYYAKYPKPCMGGWGRLGLNVTPEGKVLPCHAAESITTLAFDRVTERSLGEIWRHSAAFEAYRGTAWMPEPCRSCPRKEVDFGGCRCQAFALTGDAGRTDPACSLSPDHGIMQELLDADAAAPSPGFVYRKPGNALRLTETRQPADA